MSVTAAPVAHSPPPAKGLRLLVTGVALLLLLVGAVGFLGEWGLYRYWFEIAQTENAAAVGKIGSIEIQGGLLRQKSGEIAFERGELGQKLFNGDTLVTDSATHARLEFEDGSQVELGPATMVQLAFEDQYGWGGIKRVWELRVVSGSLKATAQSERFRLRSPEQNLQVETARATSLVVSRPAAEPVRTLPKTTAAAQAPVDLPPAEPQKPVPTLSQARVNLPKPGQEYRVATGATARKISVPLDLTLGTTPGELVGQRLKARLLDSEGRVLQEIAVAPDARGRIQKVFEIRKPGRYRWDLVTDGGKGVLPLSGATSRQFEVSPWIQAIEILDPLIAGKILKSNQLQGDLVQDFTVTLRWKPKVPAKKFSLWFGRSAAATDQLLQTEASKPEFTFNKDKLFSGSIVYRITANAENGWKITSGDQKFGFDYLPPILVTPAAGTAFEGLSQDPEGSVLFTWQKTNFTTGYELQVSADPSFKEGVVTQRLTDNLYVMPAPKAGKYFWRVRAYNKTVSSIFGKSAEFEVR